MTNYLKIVIAINSAEESDILISELSEHKFYAFEEEQNALIGYIKEEDYNEEKLKEILAGRHSFSKEVIKDENWNQQWESSFQPVIVDDFAIIRASFHEPVSGIHHDLVITPKMSFGTGHHATTFLMIKQSQNIDFHNKSVLDFGTGTGVLAILAEKLGALNVLAVDYDEWSINNALENLEANKSKNILVEQRSDLTGMGQVDIVLANINLNVLTNAAQPISDLLNKGGLLLTSGFLVKDEDAMESLFAGKQFVKKRVLNKDGWLSILFEKL